MVRRERIDVTGQSHETTQESEANWKTGPSPGDPLHCQEIVTEGEMAQMHLQALQWLDNGELAAADRLLILNCLIDQSMPDVQLELIALVERSTSTQELRTPQVTGS